MCSSVPSPVRPLIRTCTSSRVCRASGPSTVTLLQSWFLGWFLGWSSVLQAWSELSEGVYTFGNIIPVGRLETPITCRCGALASGSQTCITRIILWIWIVPRWLWARPFCLCWRFGTRCVLPFRFWFQFILLFSRGEMLWSQVLAMSHSNFSSCAPGSKRPIFSNSPFVPVEFDQYWDFLTGFKVDDIEPTRSMVVSGLSIITTVSNHVFQSVGVLHFVLGWTANWRKLNIVIVNRTLTLCIRVGVERKCMSSNPHFLVNAWLHVDTMHSAVVPTELSVFSCRVVPHHEVVLEPPGRVVVDISIVHCIQVVFNLDVKEPICVFLQGSKIAPWIS